MAKLSLELSDSLGRLADDFDQFVHGGLVLDGQSVLGIVSRLRELRRLAREMETDLSKLRWNEKARRDNARAATHDLLSLATTPGSNVKLFPVICRPIPAGQPEGAA